MTDPSSALVDALRLRDPDALTTVFNTYADKIYRLAVSILHDEVQADGVVQNTFLALIKHVDGFESRASIGTWLYRVAYNECMGRLRKQRPQVDLDSMLDEDIMPTTFVDWNTLPDAVLGSSEALAEMKTAIDKLSPNLRAVFTLRDVEELSTAETAEILGISQSVVKVRLHRARLALREHLAHYFEEYAHHD